MSDLLLKNVRPMAGEVVDVLILNGVIAEIGRDLQHSQIPVEDGKGAILIPGLVEAHTHLDKSLLGMPWYKNEVGTRLLDKIENERVAKKTLGIDAYVQSMRQALQSLERGSTHIRSHVDVDLWCQLTGVEGIQRTQEQLKGLVDIELVAFPQSGLLTHRGTLELMKSALDAGVEVIGGLDPCGIDQDPKGHLDHLFALADKYQRPIDIHLHEKGELGAFSLSMIMDRTQAMGMQGKVTVSHAFCLGMPDSKAVEALVERLAALQIAIITTGPAAQTAPAVQQLYDAGVVVGAGSDGIRDTWGPYGNGDMLERAMFLGLRNNFRRDNELALALDVCTYGGAAVMALQGYGLAVGDRADSVLLKGESLASAIVDRFPRELVIKGGRIVARQGALVVETPVCH